MTGVHPFAYFAKGWDSTYEQEEIMGTFRRVMIMVLLGSLFAAPLPAQTTSSPATTTHKKKKSHKKVSSHHGQQKIDPERARAIQTALIREHYLDGKASGVWDDASEKAMQKYQADHGWQSKTTPDSRALIKLGLGPDHEHLLNPESAMTEPPPAHAAASKAPTAPIDPPAGSQPQN
jgi:hypothetical protein